MVESVAVMSILQDRQVFFKRWGHRLDSNQRPLGYEPSELTGLLYRAP